MYILTSIICMVKSRGVTVQNADAMKEILNVLKMIFTPINAIIILAPLGNLFGKVKDKVIDTEKAKKRLIILLIAFIVILIFETNYIGDFITNLLRLTLIIALDSQTQGLMFLKT